MLNRETLKMSRIVSHDSSPDYYNLSKYFDFDFVRRLD